MEYKKKRLICSDDMEGIFTAVYDGWLWSARGTEIEISTEEPDCEELFCTCVEIAADMQKAEKVRRTIENKLGSLAYEAVCYAAVSTHPRKGTAIFHVLRRALGKGRCDRRIMEDLSDPYVNLVWKLRVKVWHELHRFFGFVRFREVGGGVLLSEITPDNDILSMLAPHFADRFPNENWMIYDSKRNKVLIHPSGKGCLIRTGVSLTREERDLLTDTEDYESLWKAFCKSVTVQERKNPHLQQQLLPLKFRTNMVEFEK